MSTDATLEGIWEDFKDARKLKDEARMRMCLKEFDLEYDSTKLPRYGPQKQMARRGVMERSIKTRSRSDAARLFGEGSW